MSDTTTTQATPATEGRDANGKFAKGNKFGRGNPFARQVAQLREEMFVMAMEPPLELVNHMRWLQAVGMEAEFNEKAEKERTSPRRGTKSKAEGTKETGGPRAVGER